MSRISPVVVAAVFGSLAPLAGCPNDEQPICPVAPCEDPVATGEGEGEVFDDCKDDDGDGFYTCVDPRFPDRPDTVDCDDGDRGVVPGGVEFPGNGTDDDCSGDAADLPPPCPCDGALLSGIGLCDGRVTSSSFEGETSQRGAFPAYFGLAPREGDGCFGAISSGRVDIDDDHVFDPEVRGRAQELVQTAQTEPVQALICTLDGVRFDCGRRFDLTTFDHTSRHQIDIGAVDFAGNVEALPLRFVFGGDDPTLPLAAPAVFSPLPNQATNEARFALVGTGGPKKKVELRIDDQPLPPAVRGLTSSTATDENGRWVYPAATLPAQTPGAHTLSATIEDDQGQLSTVDVPFVIDPDGQDTMPPATIAVDADFQPPAEAISAELINFGDDPSSGEAVNDPSSVSVEVVVPANALGFEVDLMFVTVEWPDFLCDEFNDAFRLVVESGAVAGGAATDIARDLEGGEITVNSGFFELPADWTTDLSLLPQAAPLSTNDTLCSTAAVPGCALPTYCSDGSNVSFIGSGSGWLKVRAPVVPGETAKLTFFISDTADFALDSVAFLDGFHWLPFAPPIGAVKE